MPGDSLFEEKDFANDNKAIEEEEDDEAESDFPDDLFALYADEFSLVEKCEQFARNLLKREELTPQEIVQIAGLLYAFQRLPRPTKGVSVSIALRWSNPDGYFLKTISLSEDSFRFENAGWEQGDFGSDSFGSTILEIEHGWRDGSSYEAFEWIQSACDNAEDKGYTVEIEGDSDNPPDWSEEESTGEDWQRLPRLS